MLISLFFILPPSVNLETWFCQLDDEMKIATIIYLESVCNSSMSIMDYLSILFATSGVAAVGVSNQRIGQIKKRPEIAL